MTTPTALELIKFIRQGKLPKSELSTFKYIERWVMKGFALNKKWSDKLQELYRVSQGAYRKRYSRIEKIGGRKCIG